MFTTLAKIAGAIGTTVQLYGYAKAAWHWGEKNGLITYGPPRSLSRGPGRF